MRTVKEGLNIGALSRLTGIPADTLRTWERRYGFPHAKRTAAGHRRYTSETCERLMMVRHLLAYGFKPSTILSWDLQLLRHELDRCERSEPSEAIRAATPRAPTPTTSEPAIIDRWIDYTRRFDSLSLEREFALAWDNFGAMHTLEQLFAPFLQRVGDDWSTGELQVHHEHFVAERLEGFLARRWVPLSDRASAPLVVCATPLGEHHVLGLHLAAMTFTLAGARLCFLGPNLPAPYIVAATRDLRAQGIALSVAQSYPASQLEVELRELKVHCSSVPLIIGGRGAKQAPDGYNIADNLACANQWVIDLLA